MSCPRMPSSYRLIWCAGRGLPRGIGYLIALLACGSFCCSTMPPRKMVLSDINADCRGDYCCLGRSAAHRGLLELLMIPPTVTSHYNATAGHSPSCVTLTLNTTKSELQRNPTPADPLSQ
jgi:hypothetical protein